MKILNALLLAGLVALPLTVNADDMQQPATTATPVAKEKNVSTHRHHKKSHKKKATSTETSAPVSNTGGTETK